jgi:hypothetical protein
MSKEPIRGALILDNASSLAADILCHQKERALAENPGIARLFTMGTLTGHAIRYVR